MRRDAELDEGPGIPARELETRIEAVGDRDGVVVRAAEHLERDDPAQAELAHRCDGRAGERGVHDGGGAAAHRLERAEAREQQRVALDLARLALDVDVEPRPEGEAVAEAAVARVLEVRVQVHEPRGDHAAVVTLDLGRGLRGDHVRGGADRHDRAVRDRDRAVLDRLGVDRHDPVGA